jgi:hypothetical protein
MHSNFYARESQLQPELGGNRKRENIERKGRSLREDFKNQFIIRTMRYYP